MINLHKLKKMIFIFFAIHIQMHAPTYETQYLIPYYNKQRWNIAPITEPEFSLSILTSLILHPQAPTTIEDRAEINRNDNRITIKQLKEIIKKQIFSKFSTSHIEDAADIEIALHLCEVQKNIQNEIFLLSLIYSTFLAAVTKQANGAEHNSLKGLTKILNKRAQKSKATKEYSNDELQAETKKINDEFTLIIEDFFGTQPILSTLWSYARIAKIQHQKKKPKIGMQGISYIPYTSSTNIDQHLNKALSIIEEEIDRTLKHETLLGAAIIFSYLQYIKSAESTRLALQNYNNRFLAGVLSVFSLITLTIAIMNGFVGRPNLDEREKIISSILIPTWILLALAALYRVYDISGDLFSIKAYKRLF